MTKMNKNGVPILLESRDVLRLGPGTLITDNEIRHPVENLQKQILKTQRQSRKQMLAKVYGNYLPLQLTMEENILGQFRRLPGLKSNLLGLETLLDLDTNIEFHDYLDDPEFNERSVDLHEEMERRLGDLPLKRHL